MHDPQHPVWSFLRFAIVATLAGLGMYLNASNFDETEIRALVWVVIGAGGVEGVNQYFRKRAGE